MTLNEMFKDGNMHHYDLVRQLLMASYAYYFLFEEMMRDTAYDYLCRDVADIFHLLPESLKNLLVDDSFGKTGSLFYLSKEQYPEDVIEKTLKLFNN